MVRFRKNRKKYINIPQSGECPFCEEAIEQRIIRSFKYSFLVHNLVGLDIWELSDVVEHLLLIPKRHVASLSDLSKPEAAELMKIMGEYENKDYNVYARSINSTIRSVRHQHTHLIKVDQKEAKFFFYLKKPYWVKKL